MDRAGGIKGFDPRERYLLALFDPSIFSSSLGLGFVFVFVSPRKGERNDGVQDRSQ